MSTVAAVILAAGQGTRMKSELPKVLHPICGKQMLGYCLEAVFDAGIKDVVVVAGYRADLIKKYLEEAGLKKKVKVVIQRKQLGTADAVKVAKSTIASRLKDVVILYGDTPVLTSNTIKNLVKYHIQNQADCTLLTADVEDPKQYGRIVRDNVGRISNVIEDKDANPQQKLIREINSGFACFNKDSLFDVLRKIKPDNQKKEYYLTDAVEILYSQSKKIESLSAPNIYEFLGINSKEDFWLVESFMRKAIIKSLLDSGANIIDPQTTFIDAGVSIGKNSVIYPFTVIEKNVKIGTNCQIGPFCMVREDTIIKDKVVLGNFLEINRSTIDSNTIVKHFGYLGDARIGKNVNIGAGTVTANFDGKNKNISVIKDNAFIGSDTVLVAPIKVGRGSITGAGSVVTKNKDIPDKSVAVGVPARLLKKTK